ncbi:MAG: glutamate--tRNA ligase, partial [Ferruginibacter sp.]
FTQGIFFFQPPTIYDEASVIPKWNTGKKDYFNGIISQYKTLESWDALSIEEAFKQSATEKNLKAGELQMIFRIMLVGNKTGPAVFLIAETIRKEETISRIENALRAFDKLAGTP